MPKKVVIEEVIVDGVKVLYKECTKCGEKKRLDADYDTSKTTSYGRYPSCKECRSNHSKESETAKNYRVKNRESLIEKCRKFRENNSEYVKEYDRQYKRSHKEQISKYNRKYYQENTDKLLAYSKKRWADFYYEKHKDQIILNNQKRRANLKSLPNTLTTEEVDLVLTRFNNKCALSGADDVQLDHFIALSTGFGGTVYENIVPLSEKLNKSKRDKNPFEWVKSKKDVDIEKFNKVVEYLAQLNNMTVEEYKKFVYDCYGNSQKASS